MKKIIVSTILLAVILFFGTFGYMAIESASLLDAMYMTVITITTVGFGETIPLHPVGKIFTMVLIIIGTGFMLYLFSERGGKAALATCSTKGMQIKGNVTVQGDGPSWAHPVVFGGRLYLRYADNLYCFDVKDPSK